MEIFVKKHCILILVCPITLFIFFTFDAWIKAVLWICEVFQSHDSL